MSTTPFSINETEDVGTLSQLKTLSADWPFVVTPTNRYLFSVTAKIPGENVAAVALYNVGVRVPGMVTLPVPALNATLAKNPAFVVVPYTPASPFLETINTLLTLATRNGKVGDATGGLNETSNAYTGEIVRIPTRPAESTRNLESTPRAALSEVICIAKLDPSPSIWSVADGTSVPIPTLF